MTLGRFVVLEALGAGAMGTVFAAYDPRLDRRVALKVLPVGADDSNGRQRLLREARAMASLSHPNVVAVYESGIHEGSVFVVMELVEGVTLRRWLETPRRWQDVLVVFAQAGRGLAAAHAIGLVHRDFKPDNVLIGEGEGRRDIGRVRVADFGLARVDLDAGPERGSTSPAGTNPVITQDGVAPGTPAYMAPEQFLGEPVDGRSDQFAFCVSLWEALYGQRPFGGATRFELADAIVHGRVRAPPAHDVPAWLHAVVQRGLSPDPQARHASMEVLLHALERRPARVRRRLAVVAGLGVLAASVVALTPAGTTASRCSHGEHHLAGVWDPARRSALENAFAATGALDAQHHAEQTIVSLDRFAARWVAGLRDACEATTVRGEQPSDLLDRRTQCLWRRRQSMAALVDVLTDAEAVVAEHAVRAVASLPAPESCADLAFVSRTIEPPSDPLTAARVEDLRAEIARVEALRLGGQPELARRAADALVQAGSLVDYAPVRAELGASCGAARLAAGAPAEAEEILATSYFEAVAAGADDVALRIASLLAHVVGYALRRDTEAMLWAAHAEAIAARPGVDPAQRVRRSLDVSTVHIAFGRYDEGQRELAVAIEGLRGGDNEVDLAIALNSLGTVALMQGRLDDAEASFQEALALFSMQLGEHHPNVAMVLDNLGARAWYAEDYVRAVEHQRRALEIRRSTLAADHPDIVSSLLNLAGTAMAEEDLEAARSLLEEAIAIVERRGDRLSVHADTLHNLAVVQRAMALREARDTARRALAARERAHGPDHVEVARSHANLAWILLEADEPGAAEHHFGRTLEIREAAQAPPGDVADARFGLARVKWVTPARRREAIATAAAALEEARQAGESERALEARIAEWLEEHR